MRVLFAHKTFPGQFAHVAKTLAADPKNEIVFLHLEGKDDLPGVRRLRIRPTRTASATTHYYLQSLETAVLLGQAAYRSAVKLAKGGFRPDVVYAHAGFGPGLYLKDAFPGVPVIGYFEWFYHARGGDADFLNPGDVTEDDVLRIHTRNAGLLLELWRCNRGVAPTVFQRDRFPREFREKLTVLHDGVDTDLFRPANRPTGPTLYELPDDAEIVTYATRGLEPYRGFPHFMEALARLQPTRPRLYALVVGADRVYYSKSSPDGRSCKEIVLERLPELDRSRVRFLPFLPLADYLRVLQASSVHVYLTVPALLHK